MYSNLLNNKRLLDITIRIGSIFVLFGVIFVKEIPFFYVIGLREICIATRTPLCVLITYPSQSIAISTDVWIRSNGAIIRKERIQYCEIKAITNVTRLTIIKTSWFGLKKISILECTSAQLQCTSDLISAKVTLLPTFSGKIWDYMYK